MTGTQPLEKHLLWLAKEHGVPWWDLQIAALDFAKNILNMQYLDCGERNAKCAYAREVLAEVMESMSRIKKDLGK